MFHSKFRCGSSDLPIRSVSPVIYKSLSGSERSKNNDFCLEINRRSVKSIERKPTKVLDSPKKRSAEVLEMQEQMGQVHEELKKTKVQLAASEEERDRAVDELLEMKRLAQEANTRLSEQISKESSNLNRELEIKEENIESLKLEIKEKDASADKLNEEMMNLKASDTRNMILLSESNKRIQELEGDLEKVKDSESKLLSSMVSRMKELEEMKILLAESKVELASLHVMRERKDTNVNKTNLSRDESEKLKNEVARAQEGEKKALSKSKSLFDEMGLLQNELKMAVEAEEKSQKAMDDLASALQEVAMEANQVKEKLSSTEFELENAKREAESWKTILKNTEDKLKAQLDEAKKESERFKNTAERLRLEAEESVLAWNGKEKEFVNCIKTSEDEKAATQQENTRLVELLRSAEGMNKVSREENHKLRDILKQALNESNVAKEAASIAREENSQLKDILSEKDDALDFLTRENERITREIERLRISETAALENIKELKRLLSAASMIEVRGENVEQMGICLTPKSYKSSRSFQSIDMPKENKESKKLLESIEVIDPKELKLLGKYKDVDEEPEIDEALKGSIFDHTADSPQSVATPPAPGHHRRVSSSYFTDDGETVASEDFDHLDGTQFEDADDRSSQRKKRAFIRRFGDLIRRRTLSKRENSLD